MTEGGLRFRLGIDVGGTFTDLVLAGVEGGVTTCKTPSTPGNPARGVEQGLHRLAGLCGLAVGELLARIEIIVHGTTVATNAVLTEGGARTGLLTTAGFRDILQMRRGIREEFYNNKYQAPRPLVRRYHRRPVRERIDAGGRVLTPLADDDVREACRFFAAEDMEAVAICFLHSYRNPEHEQRAETLVRECLPGRYVSASYGLLPQIRMYDRVSTTVFNAYVGPIVHRYLERLVQVLQGHGFRGQLLLMQSNGGVTWLAEAMRAPARLLLSGPAAGPLAALAVAGAEGMRDLIICDMGGTSFDVSLVRDGQPLVLREQEIDRRRLALPALGIHTIGAGGGSVAWVDSGGLLHVGPRSAGSQPGPACYGQGGTEPTTTDAVLLLGYLDPGGALDGRLRLDPQRAAAALAPIAAALGTDPEGAARGVYEVVATHMAAGIREVTVRQGYDPREFLLVAGGGAGPLFACRLAQELEIPAILVPRNASTLCAWGMLRSDLVCDAVAAYHAPIAAVDPVEWEGHLKRMAAAGRRLLDAPGLPAVCRFQAAVDMRYVGQYDEITVPLTAAEWSGAALDEVVRRFHRLHDELYGYATAEQPTEVVALRLTAVGETDKVPLPALAPAEGPPAPSGGRVVWTEATERRMEVPVFDGVALRHGHVLPGPAIVELPASTLLLLPGFTAKVTPTGSLLVRNLREGVGA